MIILNWDGTLVDTVPRLRSEAVRLISENWPNLSPEDRVELYDSTIGNSFGDQLEELFPGDIRNELIAQQYATTHRSIYMTAQLFSGVEESLVELSERHGICTSSPQKLVKNCPVFLPIQASSYFWGITGRELGRKKQQLLNWKHWFKDVTFIADSVRDWTYALEAKIKFIAVETTFLRRTWQQLGVPSCTTLENAISAALLGHVWTP